jgi:hypothetical protein
MTRARKASPRQLETPTGSATALPADDLIQAAYTTWSKLPADVRGAITMELVTSMSQQRGIVRQFDHTMNASSDLRAQIDRRGVMADAYESAFYILSHAGMFPSVVLRPDAAGPTAPPAEPALVFRTLEEWAEEDGDVLWWQLPVCEPPHVSSPISSDWIEGYTHWTPLPSNEAIEAAERAAGVER